ncbi:MAG: sulfite exporter TauE/SafE family protein [Pseudomonadales bacterium]|nr:sulfite exporter TauE/SafE family protein [Pseudomonadales bacterium]
MDFLYYILAGAGVGLAVGLTGVGGGSLMTPLLLAFGIPLHIAVGTDLLFAALTKSSAVVVHSLQKTVRWDLMLLLAMGSLPAAAGTIILLRLGFDSPDDYAGIITTALGTTLILTSVAILFRSRLAQMARKSPFVTDKRVMALTPVLGVVLGVFVTLSSVGAGAIATALLMIFYPRLKSVNVVGTDVAHAVPLTLVAGLGHFWLGNVDLTLLLALLIGSIPAVSAGSRLARFIPDRYLRPLLAAALCGIGVKFAFF